MTEKEKKRREKLLREKIQKLRLLDDEFMSKVFEDESQNLRTEQPAQQRICLQGIKIQFRTDLAGNSN